MGGIKKIAAKIAAFFMKHKGTITGAVLYTVLNWIYDNPIWMFVELRWKETGVVWMIVGAFIINAALLVYFQNKKVDFILWNALDDLAEKEADYHDAYANWGQKKTPWRVYLLVASYLPVKIAILILWCLKKSPLLGDLAALIFLPIIEDPFITTMYLRHGRKNGLQAKDYAVFLISSAISIAYWTSRNAAIVELIIRPVTRLF